MCCLLRNQPPGVPYALELNNQPSTSTEIAAAIHTDSIANSSLCSMHVWRNHPTAHEGEFVDILSSDYEPLQYLHLFLHTFLGWSNKLFPKRTQMKCYSMHLLQNNNHLYSLGRLNDEYFLDIFSRMEDDRLQYSLQGFIHSAEGVKDIDYHLGPDYIGSKGWASQQVADLLALCCEYGRPALFIIVTTNPNWPDIWEHLYPTQNDSDSPGVVAQAFKRCFSFLLMAILWAGTTQCLGLHPPTAVTAIIWARLFTKIRLSNFKRDGYPTPT